jgi:hypothetical protein
MLTDVKHQIEGQLGEVVEIHYDWASTIREWTDDSKRVGWSEEGRVKSSVQGLGDSLYAYTVWLIGRK